MSLYLYYTLVHHTLWSPRYFVGKKTTVMSLHVHTHTWAGWERTRHLLLLSCVHESEWRVGRLGRCMNKAPLPAAAWTHVNRQIFFYNFPLNMVKNNNKAMCQSCTNCQISKNILLNQCFYHLPPLWASNLWASPTCKCLSVMCLLRFPPHLQFWFPIKASL